MDYKAHEKVITKQFTGKTIPLEGLCLSITDCHHSTPKWTEKGKIVVRNFNIKHGTLNLDDPSYTSEKTFNERILRAKPEPGDLIITREAPMGEVCVIPEGVECCLGQRMVLIKPDSKKIGSQYLLYAMLSEYVQKHIHKSDKTGSIVSNLRIPDLKELEIPIVENSDKVAAVLSALDAKIELNNRINAELEAMAKTLYDYWFVQFDFPDQNGQPYKSSGGKMVYNDTLKRKIPAGWSNGTLKDLVSLEYGKPLKADIRSGSGYPVIGSSGVMDYHEEYLVSGPGIVVGRKGTVGAVTYLHDNFFPIDTTYFVKPLVDIKFYYLKYLLESLGLEKMNSDSAVPGLNREAALRSTLVIVPIEEIQKFESSINAAFEKKRNILKENQQLTQLRDWLLPMLMNGQVTVA
jgi:type I restriction enzyme, S subunit